MTDHLTDAVMGKVPYSSSQSNTSTSSKTTRDTTASHLDNNRCSGAAVTHCGCTAAQMWMCRWELHTHAQHMHSLRQVCLCVQNQHVWIKQTHSELTWKYASEKDKWNMKSYANSCKTHEISQREKIWSYHCLMINLNDFISSMDFLTAVSQGLLHRQRGRVIKCCSISLPWQRLLWYDHKWNT